MARRLGKKKQKRREEYMLKEKQKVEEGMLDEKTAIMIGKLFARKLISRINFIIAKGKEADLYVADPGEKLQDTEQVVVKIFRIETSNFGKRVDYINGDPRFEGIGKNLRNIVYVWCKKEYGNLNIAKEAKVHAPTPYSFIGNVLAMEFIGTDGRAAPILRDVMLENPKKVFKTIKDDMRKLYAHELVHGDISEYNILIKEGTPYLIDFGQAVTIAHPNAADFLRRDIANISHYFKKTYGIETDEDEMFTYITSSK